MIYELCFGYSIQFPSFWKVVFKFPSFRKEGWLQAGVVGLPSLTTHNSQLITHNSQLPSQQTTRPPTANNPSARSKHPLTCGLMPTTCAVIPNSFGRRTWRSIIRQRTPHVAPLAINALLVTIRILSRFLPFSFQRLQPSI